MSKRFINTLFAFAFVLIAILSGLTLFTFNKLTDYNDQVDKTYRVQYSLRMIEREFLVMVAAQRSYLVTEDSLYTRYYDRALGNLNTQIDTLKSRVQDNYLQVKNLDSLAIFIAERDRAFKKEVKNELEGDLSLKKRNDLILENLAISQKIVKIFTKMSDHEDLLMTERIAAQNKNRSSIPIMIWLFVFSTMAILAQAVYMLNKELDKRKLSLQKLEKAVEQLNQSNINLERFAYIASHDLQEPLRKIRIYIERLLELNQKEGKEAAKNLKYVERVDYSAERMSRLIKDLLEFSKLQGKSNLLEKIDIAYLFASKTNEILSDTEVEYTTDFVSSGVPLLNVMPSQVNRLIQNLIENSIKYRDTKKKKLKLSLQYEFEYDHEDELNYHVFVFSDNGIGFEEKYAEKIFDAFSRLVIQDKISGTGMGLSICRQIMLNHDGYIEASGEEGKGATFRLYFPDSKAEA